MAGLVPAIHVLLFGTKDVDARHKAGHDGGETGASQMEIALVAASSLVVPTYPCKSGTGQTTLHALGILTSCESVRPLLKAQ